MKLSIKLLLIPVLFFSFISNLFSQIEDYYHAGYVNVAVPITVKWQKTIDKKNADGDIINTIKKDDPNKGMYLQINIRVGDLSVNGNSFSGMQIVNFPAYDELKSFHGQVSADKQKIEFIEVVYNKTKYSLPDRSNPKTYLEENVEMSVRFENVPIKFAGYSYKLGTTNITDVSYNKMRHVEYRGQNETIIQTFSSVNESNITKWSTCVGAGFKQGKLKIKEDYNDKLTVIADDKSLENSFVRAVLALLMVDFSKIPNLKVLEGRQDIMQKIEQEIKLSESGLVLPESKVESGKFLEPDLEVIVTLIEENKGDIKYTVKTTIKDISTGKLADPGFVLKAIAKPGYVTPIEAYIDEVVEYTKTHFLF